eukprot:CAMPEP_0197041182 /NCGR_PEP_ID=MMETSP1384-20130603/17763_1 /TAXON_ID=29189 /ORGANISM="Ammonia sp." /LENGTH=236 /DNA_ID=CAMNT_0042472057 /DNA_START=627 /DNA_END=1337 /DNA_ORIENTATION=+
MQAKALKAKTAAKANHMHRSVHNHRQSSKDILRADPYAPDQRVAQQYHPHVHTYAAGNVLNNTKMRRSHSEDSAPGLLLFRQRAILPEVPGGNVSRKCKAAQIPQRHARAHSRARTAAEIEIPRISRNTARRAQEEKSSRQETKYEMNQNGKNHRSVQLMRNNHMVAMHKASLPQSAPSHIMRIPARNGEHRVFHDGDDDLERVALHDVVSSDGENESLYASTTPKTNWTTTVGTL